MCIYRSVVYDNLIVQITVKAIEFYFLDISMSKKYSMFEKINKNPGSA